MVSSLEWISNVHKLEEGIYIIDNLNFKDRDKINLCGVIQLSGDNVKPDDYNEQQEDDDDKALVILELKTGGDASYIWLGLTVLLILAGGITLIKRYVI